MNLLQQSLVLVKDLLFVILHTTDQIEIFLTISN